MGLFKVEAPQIVGWELEQYPRVLLAAAKLGPFWYVAACLAGDAGLRIGEIRALDWKDIDFVGGTITVARQMGLGIIGTPKGRTRRTVPITPFLRDALKGPEVIRRGFLVRHPDGSPMTDRQTAEASYKICRRAGLPERGWHTLRHTFGTHAAMFGANPWRLQAWMGHKRIDETMRYVHVAGDHMRPRRRSSGLRSTSRIRTARSC
jgi:integrase